MTTGSPGPVTPSGGVPAVAHDPSRAQPVWLDLAVSGRILLENGAAPPEPVAVSLSCVGPKPFVEQAGERSALTDAQGRFSLYAGLNNTPGSLNTYGGFGTPRLQGCEAGIRVPGYAPYRRDLGKLVSLADFDLGDIRLVRLARGGAGVTMSGTSARAPQKARREYISAMEDAYARRNERALAHLRTAKSLFPTYAAAHYLTGYLYDRLAQRDLARQSYEQAAAADPLYVNPILQLAQMAAEDLDYAAAARLAARVIELMPGAYAEIYVIAGGALFNSGDLAAAESTVRSAVAAQLDSSAPRLHLLLAEILWKQRKYGDARQEFLRFADAVKEGPEVESARKKAEEAASLARRS